MLAPIGAATDTLCRVHGFLCIRLGNRKSIRVRCAPRVDRDESTSLNDLVEGGSIRDEIFDDRKRASAPRFDDDHVTILEPAHVQLTHGRSTIGSVRHTIDGQRTRATNAFPAIGIECDWLLPLLDKLDIQLVDHLEERGILAHVFDVVRDETTGTLSITLSPDLEREFHL